MQPLHIGGDQVVPEKADGRPGGRDLRRGSPDSVDMSTLEAREVTYEGRGAELKYWTINLWEIEVEC